MAEEENEEEDSIPINETDGEGEVFEKSISWSKRNLLNQVKEEANSKDSYGGLYRRTML